MCACTRAGLTLPRLIISLCQRDGSRRSATSGKPTTSAIIRRGAPARTHPPVRTALYCLFFFVVFVFFFFPLRCGPPGKVTRSPPRLARRATRSALRAREIGWKHRAATVGCETGSLFFWIFLLFRESCKARACFLSFAGYLLAAHSGSYRMSRGSFFFFFFLSAPARVVVFNDKEIRMEKFREERYFRREGVKCVLYGRESRGIAACTRVCGFGIRVASVLMFIITSLFVFNTWGMY